METGQTETGHLEICDNFGVRQCGTQECTTTKARLVLELEDDNCVPKIVDPDPAGRATGGFSVPILEQVFSHQKTRQRLINGSRPVVVGIIDIEAFLDDEMFPIKLEGSGVSSSSLSSR